MPRDSFFSVKPIFQDRKKLTVFLTCVAIAIFMWLLSSLGKTYNTTILVPVKFSNFPENKTLLNDVPKQLAVNVSGSGYDIIRYEDRLLEDTLDINLNNLNIAVIGGYQQGALDPAFISKDLQERLNGMLAINRVLTDSLKFVFDLKVTRTVKVRPVVSYSLPQGYVLLDSIYSIPEEIEIIGALSILDTLSSVHTEPLEWGELDRSQKTMSYLSRKALGEDPQLSQDSVILIAQVDKLTEKSFLMEPEIRNVPDSIELLLFPRSIEITMRVPLSKFDQIEEGEVKVFVDFNEYQEGDPTLELQLESWPVLANAVKLKEKRVEIVIHRLEE